MTEADWITLIDADPADALGPASDWFLEAGDEAAAVFCRWLLKRQMKRRLDVDVLHGSREPTMVGPRRKGGTFWWWGTLDNSTYKPDNKIPFAVCSGMIEATSVEAAWHKAFDAWRVAYAAGKLEAETAWAMGRDMVTASKETMA